MSKSLDIKSLALSVIVGIPLIIFLALLTGDVATPVLPFMAILGGYIFTGIIAGLVSNDETIAEPGIASILVGVVTYLILTSMSLNCFKLLQGDAYVTNMILLTLNGIILTFAGAWAGEKLQGTLDNNQSKSKLIEWGWIICGAIVGVAISMLITNLIIKFFGFYLPPLLIALVVGLYVTGLIVGLKSPGVTIKEAALAGLFTTVINLDIFKFSIDPDTHFLTITGVLISIVLGLLAALAGGVSGERIQGD